MVKVGDKMVHFGQPGSDIRPGTPKGDAFCSRHKPTQDKSSAQYWARQAWNCKGTKSEKGPMFKNVKGVR